MRRHDQASTGLIGLPDVGDPFDVAAFHAFSVPDDQNAFVMFRQAATSSARFPTCPTPRLRRPDACVVPGVIPRFVSGSRAIAKPWLFFQQATRRPDGITPPSYASLSGLANMHLGRFVWLILLDSSRLEDRGDLAAAWDGYRAILHMKTLIMRRGTVFDRDFADQICQGLGPRFATWAANPKTDVALIRRALSDVQTLEPKPEWDAHSLKRDYLHAMSMLDRPHGWVAAGADKELLVKIGGEHLPPNLVGIAYEAYRFLINEPERSRRVTTPRLRQLASPRQRARPCEAANQPSGLASRCRIVRSTCRFLPLVRMHRPRCGHCHRKTSRVGPSRPETPKSCFFSGPGRRFGGPSRESTPPW